MAYIQGKSEVELLERALKIMTFCHGGLADVGRQSEQKWLDFSLVILNP